MITSLDVEFGPEIGSGGLYVACLSQLVYCIHVLFSVHGCSREPGIC
jgi:hypothetical protein